MFLQYTLRFLRSQWTIEERVQLISSKWFQKKSVDWIEWYKKSSEVMQENRYKETLETL